MTRWDPPFPWWPRILWRLNTRTGHAWPESRWLTLRIRMWSLLWHAVTWLWWRLGRGPRCGDYICDKPEDWPRGRVPAQITAFWERLAVEARNEDLP